MKFFFLLCIYEFLDRVILLNIIFFMVCCRINKVRFILVIGRFFWVFSVCMVWLLRVWFFWSIGSWIWWRNSLKIWEVILELEGMVVCWSVVFERGFFRFCCFCLWWELGIWGVGRIFYFREREEGRLGGCEWLKNIEYFWRFYCVFDYFD